ncbi:MAG: cupredoxin domain-containing protein [Porticoccaceae bacterium]|nr:cupredoxin domain-containing protein [Porticoccaceae bacterium]
MRVINSCLLAAALVLVPLMAFAEKPEYRVMIKDHKFSPAEIIIPANTKVTLIVENQDATPEEFESHEMHREKIIAGNKTAKIRIGPLKPGNYPFFGEFHEDTAKGVVIAQ